MTTAPYREDTPALIRGQHEQRAVLTITDGATVWATEPLTGSLTLSEDWSPHGQLTTNLANTFSAADLALMDPRENGIDVVLEAGYVHPDGTVDVHPVFRGQLEERTANTPSSVVDVKASSAELLAQEAGWLAVDTWKTFAGVTEAVTWLADYALGYAPVVVSSVGAGYRADLVNAVPLVTGQSLWEAIADIGLAADVRIYVDQDGAWQIQPRASLAGLTSAWLSTGGGGIVDKTQDTLTRREFHGAAALTYRWKDAGGTEHVIVGKYGTPGRKTWTGTRKYPASQAQADAAAQAVVRNQSTRGNSYSCEGVAAYWLRPGHTVQVTLSDGTQARHLVKKITFNFTSGTMTVVTREPTNLGD